MTWDLPAKTYHFLPYPLKLFTTGILAYYKKRKKYGEFFERNYHFLLTNSLKQQEQKAEEELEEFLEYIKKNCRFYSRYLTNNNDIKALKIELESETISFKNGKDRTKFKNVKSYLSAGEKFEKVYVLTKPERKESIQIEISCEIELEDQWRNLSLITDALEIDPEGYGKTKAKKITLQVVKFVASEIASSAFGKMLSS